MLRPGGRERAFGDSVATDAPHPASGDAVTVGLLLPFTGPTSATTRNFERAALYAADRVNAGGGIHGRNIRIV